MIASARTGRLFRKYALIFAVVVGGSLLASGLVQAYFATQENLQALTRIQREQANATGIRISQFLLETERALDGALPPPGLSASVDVDQRRLDYTRLLRQAPPISEVRYLDPAGQEQVHVSRFALNVVGSQRDQSAEPQFTEPKPGIPYFGPVYYRNDSEPYITIAEREAGSGSGVVTAEVNLKFIWDVVSRIKISDAGLAYVVDRRGQLVAHPDISLVLKKTDLSALPHVRAAMSAALVPGAPASAPPGRDITGRSVLASYEAVDPPGWWVFVEQPRDEALAPVYAAVIRTVILLLIGLGLSVLAGLLLARRMVSPIQALQAGATRIGSGQLDQRIDVHTGDELEDLAETFNQMALQLAEYYAYLQRTVAERERATLDAVMESMSDGLVVMNTGLEISYSNAQAGDLLGVAPDALRGLDPAGAIAAVQPLLFDPQAGATAWTESLKNSETRPCFDLTFEGPRDVSVQVFPVKGTEEETVGVGMVLRDMTAEHDLQRTKDELVSVVSHELRTPLASLVGFAELLLTREHPDAQRQRYLRVMLEEGRRLTSLINDFLDLQRMESGRQQLSLAPTQLGPLLERAAEAAGEDPQRKLVVDLASALPAIRADAERIQEVLANLISNARKYSPAGGEIQLATREADGMVEVSVQDPGLGLPQEAIPRLFEKFYRVDNSDRRRIKGTGLGLAICKQIVEAHGGRIWAASEGLGKGSRFTFTLPAVSAQAATGDVLLVEDDAGFAQLLEAELATRGFTSVHATSAEAALDQLPLAQPRAVVLDLVLPGLQGEAFLSKLVEIEAAQPMTQRLPVVVVTVKDLTASEQATLEELGAAAVLQKDLNAAAGAADTVARLLREGTPRAGRAAKRSGGE